MRYYIIAGEASGDLHASRLIREIRALDAEASFRGIGGELMREEGAELLHDYHHLAYMGVIPVMLHLGEIVGAMKACERDLVEWQPDVLILVDYPGFNLRMARFAKAHTNVPCLYYIAPKLWAWKEWRIRSLRRDVDMVMSILPFEVEYFEGKDYHKVAYVGNPTLDEVSHYLSGHHPSPADFSLSNSLTGRPVLALLPGSRLQEIGDNLPLMLRAAEAVAEDYEIVVAGAPGLDPEVYQRCAPGEGESLRVVYGQTYALLQNSVAALVTSGTATLETALMGVPQVVCYAMKAGWLANLGRKVIIRAPFISLVNLIAGREVVPELIAARMTVERLRRHLLSILPGGEEREPMLRGYDLVRQRLGQTGAPATAARLVIEQASSHTALP